MLLVLALGLLAAPAVWAQVRFEVNGLLNTGYTTNRNPGADEATAEADAFFEFGSGVTASMVDGRMLHALRYDLTGTVFVGDGEAASFQNALSYLSLYEIRPTVRLGVGITGSQGRQGSFRVNPTEQVVQPQRPGTVWFIGASAQQRLDWAVSSQWDLSEAFQTDWFIPTNNPFGTDGDLTEQDAGQYTGSFDLGFGAQRTWHNIALILSPRGQYLINALPNAADENARFQHAWLFTGTAGLRWDFARSWTMGVEAGAQLSLEGDFSEVAQPGPVGRATLGYRWQRWSAGLSAGYEQTPNIQVATIFEGATLALNGVMPVGHRRLRMWIEGAVGYTYSSPVGDIVLGETAGINDAVDIHTIGVDVAYNWRFSDVMEVAIRYQFGMQRSVGLTPENSGSFAQDFTVHVGMLSLRFNYPARRNRRRRRRGLGGPSRVDREEWDSIFNPTPGRSNNDQPPPNSGNGS
ncbi:MAG: hypothetical protein CSB49_02805 [Proteobacteria bacterium]|nr:MAG: hypothetical protein CSB49_02805 [Pseudomonadota bacterium]